MEARMRGLSHESLDVLRAHQVLKHLIFYRNEPGYPTFLILLKCVAVRCAAGFALLNLPKGKSLGRSKPATNS